jgi:hypothetical protein
MLRKIAVAFAFIAAATFAQSADAHIFQQKFNTMHYSVNEVILGSGEVLDTQKQNKIVEEVQAKARGLKYQTVTAVFPPGAAGLAGKVGQPLAGLLTITNYGSGKGKKIEWRTQNVFATNIGIVLNTDLLRQFVDNRVIAPLLSELRGMPLILSDLTLETNTRDFRGFRFYTFKDRSFVIDTAVVDSLFYNVQQRAQVKPGCKITMMVMADNVSTDTPLFIRAHGTVNSISCPTNK